MSTQKGAWKEKVTMELSSEKVHCQFYICQRQDSKIYMELHASLKTYKSKAEQ